MKHTNSTNSNAFSDEVEVDFHVLGALMLNGVGGEVDGADVVAVDEAGVTTQKSTHQKSQLQIFCLNPM